MTFILIDETVRDPSYMKDAITFVSNYIQGKFVMFHPYKTVANLHQRSNKATIEKCLLKLRHQTVVFDSNEVREVIDKSYEQFHFSEQYIGQVKYIQANGDTVIVLCDPTKFKADIKEINGTYFINHYAEELNSNISKWISGFRSTLVKGVIAPTTDMPLPNSKLCSNYKSVLDTISHGKGDKKSDYILVGSEVAYRNGYSEDHKTERLNRGAIRKIFVCDQADKVFVSIDVENGALEAFNKRGRHLGAYSYIGKQTDSPDKSGKHDIKV
mgnify:FL=1